MADGPAALARLCDPASDLSCHYVVEETGHVLQLVAEARRAWHAGRSSWAGETDMNSASIGIEIANVQVQYLGVIETFLVNLTGGQTVTLPSGKPATTA